MPAILIRENSDDLSHYAAEYFVTLASVSAGARGRFAVALAGGSTPKALYRLLASDRYRNRIDWDRVYFFFGDERWVPPDSDESNFRIARETMLEPLSIPPDRIFPWRTGAASPQIAANDYAAVLRNFFGSPRPDFDLILLGLGSDAHTASLFPYSPALDESSTPTAANWIARLDAYRLTLTFPAINNASHAAFLVTGSDKSEAVRNVIEGERDPVRFPAQRVEMKNGELVWLLDRDAASHLSEESKVAFREDAN